MNLYAYAGGNPATHTDPSGLLFGFNAGEGAADSAVDYWANLQAKSINGFASFAYATMGTLAEMWTPCHSDQTAIGLASATGVGIAGRLLAAARAAAALAAGNGSGITVLGSWPGYEAVAQELGANYFSMPAEEWAQMTAGEQWAANQAFLDAAIARGDSFVFANDFAPAASSFEKELFYLQQQGVFSGVPGEALAAAQ